MEQSGSVENLMHAEAVEKIKELVKHNSICIFTTNIQDEPTTGRPMTAKQVDDAGNLWFLSAVDSNKNEQIANDPWVELYFSNPSDSEFLIVYGKASISRDRQKIEDIWTPIAKAWFKEGKDDPTITAIKVKPEDAYYWDTKSNKMVSMLKILASTVSGKSMDDGVEGKLIL